MRNSAPTIANTIDGKCENIPNHFAGIYKDLYDSADAVMHLKEEKRDRIFDFSSDCVKNAPFIFYEHLAIFFRTSLMHGHISTVLLLATLDPILKDKLGDM